MSATPTPAITIDRRGTVSPTVLWVELRDELLGIVREPTALFFSVLMPASSAQTRPARAACQSARPCSRRSARSASSARQC